MEFSDLAKIYTKVYLLAELKGSSGDVTSNVEAIILENGG